MIYVRVYRGTFQQGGRNDVRKDIEDISSKRTIKYHRTYIKIHWIDIENKRYDLLFSMVVVSLALF